MRVMALVSRKGGVGKSTSALNLAWALADRGRRVLLIDADTSAGLARALGRQVGREDLTLYEVLVDGRRIEEGAIAIRDELLLLAADERLAVATHKLPLMHHESWQHRLADAIGEAGELAEITVIDTPPSLDTLTLVGLVAAEAVIIPTQLEAASAQAVRDTLTLVARLRGDGSRRALNPGLGVFGVLPTFAEFRTRHSRLVAEEMTEEFRPIPMLPAVPLTVRVRESVAVGSPIVAYDPGSNAAGAYRATAALIEEALCDAR